MSNHSRLGVRVPGIGDRWDPFENMEDDGDDLQAGPHAGKGPRNYRRRDERIREDICVLLERSGDVDATAIEVIVTEGEVFLMGAVPDRQQKRLAEQIADIVAGVRDVHNRLELPTNGPPSLQEEPTTESTIPSAGREQFGVSS